MTDRTVKYLSKRTDFESGYLNIRDKENRVLKDEQVLILPEYEGNARLVAEWKLRKRTFERFLVYLDQHAFRTALDIGCGNGWFTHGISKKIQGMTVGLDMNASELEQANRVFQDGSLEFCYGDIFQDIFPVRKFQLVVFNASVQYFPDFVQLMARTKEFMDIDGEIHILDSPFYTPEQIPAAKERSMAYYAAMGFPEMGDQYFHHSFDSLQSMQAELMYRPRKINRILGRKDSPFNWYRIKVDHIHDSAGVTK